MKNAEIILQKQVELMKLGYIKGTKNYFHFHPTPETVEYIQIPEPIFNKAEAERKGYRIKTDAVPLAPLMFPIWIPTANGMILKNTQFYTEDQLERVIM